MSNDLLKFVDSRAVGTPLKMGSNLPKMVKKRRDFLFVFCFSWKDTFTVFHMKITTPIFELQKIQQIWNPHRNIYSTPYQAVRQSRIFDFESSLLIILKNLPKNCYFVDIVQFVFSPKWKMFLPVPKNLGKNSKERLCTSYSMLLWILKHSLFLFYRSKRRGKNWIFLSKNC